MFIVSMDVSQKNRKGGVALQERLPPDKILLERTYEIRLLRSNGTPQ
jgi:hypothetical protein